MFGPGVSTMPNATSAKAKRLVSDGMGGSPRQSLSLKGPRLPGKELRRPHGADARDGGLRVIAEDRPTCDLDHSRTIRAVLYANRQLERCRRLLADGVAVLA